ncbi:MAG: hypothetical protein EP332_06465 [Bacteroidetes bacterium]|nr:MAG: hypothetical protein EP332_06465 [Bacteroidota bacterium]
MKNLVQITFTKDITEVIDRLKSNGHVYLNGLFSVVKNKKEPQIKKQTLETIVRVLDQEARHIDARHKQGLTNDADWQSMNDLNTLSNHFTKSLTT